MYPKHVMHCKLFSFMFQEQGINDRLCNCSNRVSIEYLAEGRYRLGDKTLFIRVGLSAKLSSSYL